MVTAGSLLSQPALAFNKAAVDGKQMADAFKALGVSGSPTESKDVTLTDTEYAMLEYLLKNRGSTVTAAELYESVWKERFLPGSGNTVMVHVLNLRRKIEAGVELRSTTARELMTPSPQTIREDVLAAEAVALMEARRINTLLVVDAAGVLVGAVSTNDLMRAKVI